MQHGPSALEGLHIPPAVAPDAQRQAMAEQAAINRVVVDRFELASHASVAGMPRDDRCLAELVQRPGGGEQFQLNLFHRVRSQIN